MKPIRSNYSFWLIGIVAFCYICVRTFTVAITYDECWTLFGYARTPVWDIVSYSSPAANNHILNSLLTKLCIQFSESEFAIRLPNLLASILYFYAAYKISLLYFKNQWQQLGLFTTLIGNFTLLTFFGLCRGYGLAIALMLFSIYQLISYSQTMRKRQLHLSLLTIALSMYANFSMMPALLALMLTATFVSWHRSGKLLDALKLPLLYSLAIAAISAYPIYRMVSMGEAYFGGEKGFIQDTVYSVLQGYFGFWAIFERPGITSYIILALIIAGCVFTYRNLKTSLTDNIRYTIPVTILLVAILLINLQFYLLGVKLPVGRTGLYLFPLLMLSLFTLFSNWKNKYQTASTALCLAFGVLSIFNVVKEANFISTRDWWDATYTKSAIQYIVAHLPKEEKGPIHVMGMFSTDNSMNYYAERLAPGRIATIVKIFDADTVNYENYDYAFIRKDYRWPADNSFKIVQAYQDSTYLLFEKK
ncbi:MAG: hypothetical protein JST70_16160 [Bacteroidetes bacterium]|nr:hypothetical protein [Bacteroidota bacterium]